jgi:hypothetical protein
MERRRGGKGPMVDVCDEAPDFLGIRDSRVEVREFLASETSDIPICDEPLLPGISPFRLDHGPYDLSLCDCGPNFHRDFGVLVDTMFVSVELVIPRTPMVYGR